MLLSLRLLCLFCLAKCLLLKFWSCLILLVLIRMYFDAGRANWQQALFALAEVGDGLLGVVCTFDFLVESRLGE